MKKNVLFLLSSSILLSSCSFSGLVNKLLNRNSDQNQNGVIDPKPDSGNQTKPTLTQEYVATIKTHGTVFSSSFPEGYNFELNDAPTLLKEYLDSGLEYYDLISEISDIKCTTREVDSDTYLQIGTGSPAKERFNEGTFTWKSEVKIYKVEIKAFNYSNPYKDYSTGEIIPNVDTNGHIHIDGDDNSLEISSTSSPVKKTFSKEYINGVNEFTLKSTGGRVLIEELTITWRG